MLDHATAAWWARQPCNLLIDSNCSESMLHVEAHIQLHDVTVYVLADPHLHDRHV